MSIIILDNELKLTGGFGIWCFVAYLKIIWYKDTLFKKRGKRLELRKIVVIQKKQPKKLQDMTTFLNFAKDLVALGKIGTRFLLRSFAKPLHHGT